MADVFTFPIQVRYLEADQQGVVFNMWYLAYFDDAMAAFLAHGGLTYPDLMAAGWDVQLVHTDLGQPVRLVDRPLPDQVLVAVGDLDRGRVPTVVGRGLADDVDQLGD